MTQTYLSKPSDQMTALLSGAVSYDDAPDWLQSLVSLTIYREAKRVLAGPTREDRAKLLQSVPVGIRPQVEANARKLFAKK